MQKLPIVAVVLAAGTSSRMGEQKLLLPWGMTTVLGQTLRNLQASSVDHILVVTGHQRDAVVAEATAHHVQTVQNPNFLAGEMLSSLQCGVRHLPEDSAAVLAVLADQPLVESKTIDKLLTAHRAGAGSLIAPVFAGRRGNPVLIDRRYFAELLALPPGSAPRILLQRHAHELHLVPVASESVLLDLDRPETYRELQPKYSSSLKKPSIVERDDINPT